MKLQKQLSRKVRGKEYSKYVVTISPRYIEKLGWQKGIELEVRVSNNRLIVEPKNKKQKDNSN